MELRAVTKTEKIMEKNYKILLAYDGTRYHGWERKNNTHALFPSATLHIAP